MRYVILATAVLISNGLWSAESKTNNVSLQSRIACFEDEETITYVEESFPCMSCSKNKRTGEVSCIWAKPASIRTTIDPLFSVEHEERNPNYYRQLAQLYALQQQQKKS